MVATRLQLYNGALRLMASRSLATLTDDVESRYILDEAWDDGAVQYCLESGYWTFAMRTSKLTNDPDLTPLFGYTYAFTKPPDYIKLAQIAADPYFDSPIQDYTDETDQWYTTIDTIYIQYLSSDSNYGLNYAAWPQSFSNFVQAYIASQSNLRITKSETKQDKIDKLVQKSLRDARGKNAMNLPTKFLPQGTWTRSRRRITSVPQGLFSNDGTLDY